MIYLHAHFRMSNFNAALVVAVKLGHK